jgi:phage repressor protein C with HTH and peptisase S24 domain
MMLSHERVWAAIDALAARYGMTASGLARKAGLDATSFNKSKRTSPEGRDRWPSTESIAKILRATGASLDEFFGMADAQGGKASLPSIASSALATEGLFGPDGKPGDQKVWRTVPVPRFDSASWFSVEVDGDQFEPAYRQGDLLLLAVAEDLNKGDRALIVTLEGALLAGYVSRRAAREVTLKMFSGEERIFELNAIRWMARILWARH